MYCNEGLMNPDLNLVFFPPQHDRCQVSIKLYICFFINVVRENFVEFLERNTNDPADKALGYTGIMRDAYYIK